VDPVIIRNVGKMTYHQIQVGLTNALTANLTSMMNTSAQAPEDFPALPALQAAGNATHPAQRRH